MNEYLASCVFTITLVSEELFLEVKPRCFLSFLLQAKQRGTPEVLSSLNPSFSTSWDFGIAPAAPALASRNWHWAHCLQWEAHGCGLKVHSWDQNAVWNTNSLCALTALFPWLPHPHQASRTKLPPLAHVSTCGLSFYSHPHALTHTRAHEHARLCHFDDEVQTDNWAIWAPVAEKPLFFQT